jgi:hypothetical protein
VKLRCKDGDIAVITWDHPDCLENIGRLVQVRGPLKIEDEVAYWRIQPVTPLLYAFRELDDTLARDRVTWSSRIQHPDRWMIPIEPDEEANGTDEVVLLHEPTPACVASAASSESRATRTSAFSGLRSYTTPGDVIAGSQSQNPTWQGCTGGCFQPAAVGALAEALLASVLRRPTWAACPRP